jgi:hypothetical protein
MPRHAGARYQIAQNMLALSAAIALDIAQHRPLGRRPHGGDELRVEFDKCRPSLKPAKWKWRNIFERLEYRLAPARSRQSVAEAGARGSRRRASRSLHRQRRGRSSPLLAQYLAVSGRYPNLPPFEYPSMIASSARHQKDFRDKRSYRSVGGGGLALVGGLVHDTL